MRLGELVATFSLAQDNAFGQPLESQFRSCLLASWLAEEAGFPEELRRTIYWVALLRYVGCTGHAHEVASVFGDEIALRAQTLVHDAANPEEVMHDVVAFATAGHPPEEHDQIASALLAGAQEWAVHNFASGCEVGDMLVRRLGLPDDVRDSLGFTFERWNGNGYPTGARGTSIPIAMRVVHLTHDMEAIARRLSPAAAIDALQRRRGQTYDPDLVDQFAEHADSWLERLGKVEPWDAVLDLEPRPHRRLSGSELDEALAVAADFIDLKSPYMAGHSRRCADLAATGAAVLGLDEEVVIEIRRGALIHELGTTALPNSILDKTSALTRSELDRVELHPMLTEQMLRRSPALAMLIPIAAAHHEKADGSGYHRRLTADGLEPGAALLVAADIFVALTTDRADRPAATGAGAAAHLRRLVVEGQVEGSATEAVLAAAGQSAGGATAAEPSRKRGPAGLSNREIEVLCLAARGLTTKQIGERLFISPKTADHHIQHVYAKIGVSTRAAAALWSMQNGVVN